MSYAAAQAAFEKILTDLQIQTEHAVRARLNVQEHPTQKHIDAHEEARKALLILHTTAETLRVERDRARRDLKGH